MGRCCSLEGSVVVYAASTSEVFNLFLKIRSIQVLVFLTFGDVTPIKHRAVAILIHVTRTIEIHFLALESIQLGNILIKFG